jgi:hypothetical protein
VIADLGISKAMRTTVHSQTQSHAAAGTPAFMSPEQFDPSFGRPGFPSDIWALGCVLITMLLGESGPWGEMSSLQISTAVTVRRQSPAIPPAAPDALAGIIRRCLAHGPAKRERAVEVKKALMSLHLAVAASAAAASAAVRVLLVQNISAAGGEGLHKALHEEEYGLARVASATPGLAKRTLSLKSWPEVTAKLAESQADFGFNVLVLSGHGGVQAFDHQPPPPDCATDVCRAIARGGCVVLNSCSGRVLAEVIHAQNPALTVVFWAGPADTTVCERMVKHLCEALERFAGMAQLNAGTAFEVVRARVLQDAGVIAAGVNDLQALGEARRSVPPEELARLCMGLEPEPEQLQLDGLNPVELYDSMRETRVLFSFGCARGGINAAIAIRGQLLQALHWGEDAVYIDAINLKDKPGSYIIANGTSRNNHWAEYYFMATLLAHTVVVILDPAWLASGYCQGELQIFLRNAFLAHQAAKSEEFPGSQFQLVVMYDTETAQGTEAWARAEVETWNLPGAAAPALFLPVRLLGASSLEVQRQPDVIARDSFDALCACITQRSAVEAAVPREAAADRAGYAALYHLHWQQKALSQHEDENKEAWWWTPSSLSRATSNHSSMDGESELEAADCEGAAAVPVDSAAWARVEQPQAAQQAAVTGATTGTATMTATRAPGARWAKQPPVTVSIVAMEAKPRPEPQPGPATGSPLIVSGSSDKTVRLWDPVTFKCQQTLVGHKEGVMSAAFSPEGRQIVSASTDKTVRIWNAATGNCDQRMQGHTHWLASAAFSPDGLKIVSAGWDQTLRVWSVATGNCEQTMGHGDLTVY